MELKKPRKRKSFLAPRNKPRLDYLQCAHYLEKKYKYTERDYAGRSAYHFKCRKEVDAKFGENGWWTTAPADFTTKSQHDASDLYEKLMEKEPPYQDFWHFLLKHCKIKGNGCCFNIYKDRLMAVAEPWQKEILQHYFDEFDPKGTGKIEFYVWW